MDEGLQTWGMLPYIHLSWKEQNRLNTLLFPNIIILGGTSAMPSQYDDAFVAAI